MSDEIKALGIVARIMLIVGWLGVRGKRRKRDNPSSDHDRIKGADQQSKHAVKHGPIADAIHGLIESNDSAQEQASVQHRANLTWTKRATVGVGTSTSLTFVLLAVSFCNLQVSKEVEQLHLRAYVGGPEMPTTVDLIDGKLIAHSAFTNSGETPAQHLHLDSVLAIVDWPLDNIGSRVQIEGGDPVVIFPKQRSWIIIRSNPGTTVSQADYDGTSDQGSKKTLVLIGSIRYKDVWGKPHLTEYCFFKPKATTDGLWFGCAEHNDTF